MVTFENADASSSQGKESGLGKIPEWVKNSAGWWAKGDVDDNDYIQGMAFLVKEGIMKIPPTTQGEVTGSKQIPEWVKNNAGWWAKGDIDDSSFVQGMQFLIREGIMSMPATAESKESILGKIPEGIVKQKILPQELGTDPESILDRAKKEGILEWPNIRPTCDSPESLKLREFLKCPSIRFGMLHHLENEDFSIVINNAGANTDPNKQEVHNFEISSNKYPIGSEVSLEAKETGKDTGVFEFPYKTSEKSSKLSDYAYVRDFPTKVRASINNVDPMMTPNHGVLTSDTAHVDKLDVSFDKNIYDIEDFAVITVENSAFNKANSRVETIDIPLTIASSSEIKTKNFRAQETSKGSGTFQKIINLCRIIPPSTDSVISASSGWEETVTKSASASVTVSKNIEAHDENVSMYFNDDNYDANSEFRITIQSNYPTRDEVADNTLQGFGVYEGPIRTGTLEIHGCGRIPISLTNEYYDFNSYSDDAARYNGFRAGIMTAEYSYAIHETEQVTDEEGFSSDVSVPIDSGSLVISVPVNHFPTPESNFDRLGDKTLEIYSVENGDRAIPRDSIIVKLKDPDLDQHWTKELAGWAFGFGIDILLDNVIPAYKEFDMTVTVLSIGGMVYDFDPKIETFGGLISDSLGEREFVTVVLYSVSEDKPIILILPKDSDGEYSNMDDPFLASQIIDTSPDTIVALYEWGDLAVSLDVSR